jgi:hypothetical protein
MITKKEVREKIKELKKYIKERDWEAAHGTEEQIRLDILRAVAEGSVESQKLAKIAVKLSKIDFPRWCG